MAEKMNPSVNYHRIRCRKKTHLDVIEIRFAHVLIAEGEIGAPSVIFVDSGRAEHPASRRGSRRRTRGTRVHNRTPIASAADATAAAAASGCAVVVFPGGARRRRTQGSDVNKITVEIIPLVPPK